MFDAKSFKKKQILTVLMCCAMAVLGLLTIFLSYTGYKHNEDDNSGGGYYWYCDENYNDYIFEYVDAFSYGYESFYVITEYTGSASSLTLPDSIYGMEYIVSDTTFGYNSTLTSLTLGTGTAYIASGTFYGCSSLNNITVSSGNTYYKSSGGNLYSYDGTELVQYAIGKTATSFSIPSGVTAIGDCAFSGNETLTSINTFSSGVETIGDYAFYNCTGLESAHLNTVTSIGEYAFCDCTALESVTLGNDIETIGKCAFGGCNALDGVYYYGTASQWAGINFYDADANPLGYAGNLYIGISNLTTDITIEGITEISDYAFYGCTSLESVTIGSGVTSVGDYAFYGCINLTSISYPSSISIGVNAW